MCRSGKRGREGERTVLKSGRNEGLHDSETALRVVVVLMWDVQPERDMLERGSGVQKFQVDGVIACQVI